MEESFLWGELRATHSTGVAHVCVATYAVQHGGHAAGTCGVLLGGRPFLTPAVGLRVQPREPPVDFSWLLKCQYLVSCSMTLTLHEGCALPAAPAAGEGGWLCLA